MYGFVPDDHNPPRGPAPKPRRFEIGEDIAVIEHLDAPPLPWDDRTAGRAQEMFEFATSKADAFIVTYGAEDPFEAAVRDSVNRIAAVRQDSPPIVLSANFTGWTRMPRPHDVGAALRLCENIGVAYGGEVDLQQKGQVAKGIDDAFYEAVKAALERKKAEEERLEKAEEEENKGFKGKFRKFSRGIRSGSMNVSLSLG